MGTPSVAGSFPPGSPGPRADPVPLGFVFRSRAKTEKAPAADKATVTDSKQPRHPEAPKGRYGSNVPPEHRRRPGQTPIGNRGPADISIHRYRHVHVLGHETVSRLGSTFLACLALPGLPVYLA